MRGHAYYSPRAGEVGGALNWTFFAAGPVLAGFEPAAPIDAVIALWRLAQDPDATVESVVAAIPTRGPDAIDSFVVVVLGERLTLVARGAGSGDVVTRGGSRRIDSRQMQPWYLAEFDGAIGVSLGSAERPLGADNEPARSDLPISNGLVRAPWLAWTVAAPGREALRPVETERGGGDAPMQGEIPAHQPSAPITGSIPVQRLAVAPGPYRSAINSPIPVIPAAEVTGEIPPLPAAPPVPRAPGPLVGAEDADLDDTVRGLGSGRRAIFGGDELPSRGSSVADEPHDELGDVGDTIVIERSRHRADVPPVTSWSPSRIEFDPRFASRDAKGRYHCFRIGRGQVYRLDTPVYIGRKPSSPRIVTGAIPRLLKVPSPSMEVSGTHVELRQEGDSVVVTDMRSTNGTFVALPGAAHVKLRQGESLVVPPGARVDIGDGNVIEILPAR